MSKSGQSNKEIEQTALLLSEDDDDLLDNHDNFNQTKQTSTTLTQNGALFSQKASTSQSNDQQNGNSKLNRVQNQINDVMDGMKTNIGKILERGQTLDNLNERSDELSASANLFHTRAKSTRKAMWLRTCRARLYLGGTIAVILILLMFFVYRVFKN